MLFCEHLSKVTLFCRYYCAKHVNDMGCLQITIGEQTNTNRKIYNILVKLIRYFVPNYHFFQNICVVIYNKSFPIITFYFNLFSNLKNISAGRGHYNTSNGAALSLLIINSRNCFSLFSLVKIKQFISLWNIHTSYFFASLHILLEPAFSLFSRNILNRDMSGFVVTFDFYLKHAV